MEATFTEISKQAKKEARRRIRGDADRVSPALRPVLERIAKRVFDKNFDVNSLSGDVRLTTSQWNRFREELATTPWQYVTRHRLELADLLVTTTDATFVLIADCVGKEYSDFGAWYRRNRGISPSAARETGAGPRPRAPLTDETVKAWCTKLAQGVDQLEAELGHDRVVEIFRKRLTVRTAQLFEALCVRSREEGWRDARRGVELAELAVASIEGGALGELGPALYVRGLARLGNARRLANDHAGSERELRRAAKALERVTLARRAAVKGELLLNRGTLRLFRRRFEEAAEDLHRAVGLCKSTGQKKLEASAYIQLAALDIYSGNPTAARSALFSARQIVEAEFAEDGYLRLGVLLQLARIQAESDHGSEASPLIMEARRLAAEVDDPKAEFQLDWIEALARRGEPSMAERLLRRAHQGFLGLGDVDYTAIVSLDLALLCESRGRVAEVVSLAAEALPALEVLRFPEALEALRLLRHAIDTDQISREVLLTARKFLIRI